MATEVTVVCNSAIGKEDKNYNSFGLPRPTDNISAIGFEPIYVITK